MATDQDAHLGYDADHDDPRQYCKHGTFIGSWWGPDYLCMDCELGTTDREYVLGSLHQSIAYQRNMLAKIYPFTDEDVLVNFQQVFPYNVHLATFLVEQFYRHEDEIVARWSEIQATKAELARLTLITDEAHFTKILKAWRG